MKLLWLIFAFVGVTAASNLISSKELETLFQKYMLNELTEEENKIFRDSLEIFFSPELSQRSFDYSQTARQTINCILCRSAFGALIQNIRNGQTDAAATDSIVTLCTNLGIESYNVCYGAISLNMPILAHIIRTVPEATSHTFCGLVLQRGDDKNFCSFNDTRFEWEVDLPPKNNTVLAPVYDPSPLKIGIISDAHIDPQYEAFGVAECDEPTCCRFDQKPATRFSYKSNVDETLFERSVIENNGETKLNLSVADEIRKQKKSSRTMYQTRQNSAPAGYWGDYRNCDTPVWAFDDALENLHENHKDLDLIYYMGDTIDHGVWETSFALINNANQYLIERIREIFGDNVKVVPVIGNHEAQPTNQFAPSSIVGAKLNTTWLYQGLVDRWGFYLTEEAKATLLKQGGFSMVVRPGLRVISLNNNVAYKTNWWLVYDPLDAKTHLDWLVQELYKAELAGEKVHILAHIPPGVPDLTYTWTREYNRIINRFSATIAAQFTGHSHSDEFKVFYSPEGSPINVMWGAGSITAHTFYNLNYKIATFVPGTFVPDSILNYAYNLTEANLTPQRKPHWFMLYDIKNSYGLTDLSPQSMNDLVYSMVTNNKRSLELYAAFHSKINDQRWKNCNAGCKLDHLCRTVVTVLWERQRCDELNGLFYA